MQQEEYNNHAENIDDDMSLLELAIILWKQKLIIVYATIFFSIFGIFYSLNLPNIFESKAILVPVNASSSISSALKNYSSIGRLAGINLPDTDEEVQNHRQAMQKLVSLSFFENSIMPNIFLPDLMALNSWDHKRNTLDYDANLYDINSATWVRDFSYPYKQIPSAQESFEIFRDHFSLSKDSKTGFVYLSVKHQSPYIAKEWSELLIKEVNAYYRKKDKSESEKTVTFLNKQIALTNLSEVKEVISQLLQEETQKLALIEANEYYVFDYIDPPAVMEIKSDPRRSIICIVFAFIGGIFGVFIVLLRYFVLKYRAK